MRKLESKVSAGRARPRAVRAEDERSMVLMELGARFARFRAEHQRGARVPGELREAALEALGRGASTGELYRSCGITWGQLEAWKRRAAPPEVRAFSVVEEPPAEAARPAAQTLEMQMGEWSVTVRFGGAGGAR